MKQVTVFRTKGMGFIALMKGLTSLLSDQVLGVQVIGKVVQLFAQIDLKPVEICSLEAKEKKAFDKFVHKLSQVQERQLSD